MDSSERKRRGINRTVEVDEPTPAEICKEIGHDWEPYYDEDRNIVGRICTRCSLEEGRRG